MSPKDINNKLDVDICYAIAKLAIDLRAADTDEGWVDGRPAAVRYIDGAIKLFHEARYYL